jgi:beta-phosphoglucomutase family hydrolase
MSVPALQALPSLDQYRVVLFDLDGVLTPTADLHMHAWRAMFEELFARKGVTQPYTDDDYFLHLDGKQRYEGVASILRSRGIELDWGFPTDPSSADTVCGIGNRKNDVFSRVLDEEGVQPYPGSLRLVEQLQAKGVPMGIVSSSKNAETVLVAAGIRDRFPVLVDGVVAARETLGSKPAPDMFEFGAKAFGVAPADAVVFEDAISGVAAARAGAFGLVVGVDRGVGSQALVDAGADVVVADLGEFVEVAK